MEMRPVLNLTKISAREFCAVAEMLVSYFCSWVCSGLLGYTVSYCETLTVAVPACFLVLTANVVHASAQTTRQS